MREQLSLLIISLLALVAGCAPSLSGSDSAAIENARAEGVPIIIDEVQIIRGISNDTSIRMEITAVNRQTVGGLIVRARVHEAIGKPILNRTDGSVDFSFCLERVFSGRHRAIWGP